MLKIWKFGKGGLSLFYRKPKKMGSDKKKKPSKLVVPVRQLEKAAKFLKDQPSPKPSKWEKPTTADKSGERGV